MMSTMSPGPSPSPNGGSSNGGFTIRSPDKGEQEVRILQNVNQIMFGGSSKIGIIGTQELTEGHQQMIELLSYALVLSGNHIVTSAGSVKGTNIGVIRGALRANNPDLLTVILPQSLSQQSDDVQEVLQRVVTLVEQPKFDDLDLKSAANLCNAKIISMVTKILVFATHESKQILEPLEDVKETTETIQFYLD
jgi:hypothetical protein